MKKNKLILLQLFIAFTLICTSVYATVTTTINVSVDKTTIKRGETVVVTLSLDKVESSKKVTSVEGYINYNKDVIEPLTVDSIEKDENNKVKIEDEVLDVEDLTDATSEDMPASSAYVGFNGNPETENDSKIVIDFKDGITKNTDLIKVKFKVKSNATIGEIKEAISYSMFVITAGNEESEEPITKNINLTIEKAATSGDGENDKNENKADDKNENKADDKNENKNEGKNENKNENKNTNTNTNKNVNTNTNTNTKDNTVAGAKIPAAGTKVFIVPAIILIVLAYVSYNKYMKMKDI